MSGMIEGIFGLMETLNHRDMEHGIKVDAKGL